MVCFHCPEVGLRPLVVSTTIPANENEDFGRFRPMRSLNASLCILALVFGLCGSLDSAGAQSWPNRTITLIIPFPPGGSTSIVGRVIADKMSQQLGQGIVVDNRAGAGGTVGTK